MYLDPGFGSMLIQVLVAVIAAGGVLLFSLRRKISKLFSHNKADSKDVNSAPKTSLEKVDTNDVIDSIEDDS